MVLNFTNRIARVQAMMMGQGVDRLVLGNQSGDAEYMVGLRRGRPDGTDHYYPGEWLGVVVLEQSGGATVIAPWMARGMAQHCLEGKPWIAELIVMPEHVDHAAFGKAVLDRLQWHGKRVALGYRHFTRTVLALQEWYPQTKWLPANAIMETVRMIKDADEIALLEEAGRITDLVYSDAVRFLQLGVTEEDVAAEIWRLGWHHGGEGTSFASGIVFLKDGLKRDDHTVHRLAKTKLTNGMSIAFDTQVSRE